MTIVKRFLVSLAAFTVLAGVLVAVTSVPANASYATCPSGQSCLYTGQNGGGTQRALAFSTWGPVGTCRNITLMPVGGYHSAIGGYGSGYALSIYSGANCTGWLRNLYFNQNLGTHDTWSSAFSSVVSVRITQ